MKTEVARWEASLKSQVTKQEAKQEAKSIVDQKRKIESYERPITVNQSIDDGQSVARNSSVWHVLLFFTRF